MTRPLHDPVRNVIYAAGDRAIRAVYVDGGNVVENGRVLTIDYHAAAEALHEAQARVEARAPELDWGRRTADGISPRTFPDGCQMGD